jgi:hypothetical protein
MHFCRTLARQDMTQSHCDYSSNGDFERITDDEGQDPNY